jgi:hypothetical protein
MTRHARAFRPVLITASVLAASVCGFSRPPSKALEFPTPVEITVRESRGEAVDAAGSGSPSEVQYRSSITHHGRLEAGSCGEENGSFAVFTDSLVFVSEAPFCFTARLGRDTIDVASDAKRPAAQMGMIEGDRKMLACIFEGPSVWIGSPGGDEPAFATIEDAKSGCAGGLYRRLNLPATVGAFSFSSLDSDTRLGARWSIAGPIPSLSGLGFFPQVNWTFAFVTSGPKSATASIELSCDTMLAGTRATMPNGERVYIIADRITIRGRVRPVSGASLLHEGTITIHEDLRYIRPALGSEVLQKRCELDLDLRTQ